MPTFQYRALQSDGTIAEGQLEAAGRPDAFRQMEGRGLRPVSLSESASTDQIREAARKAGMKTLAEDGWRLVRLGMTTVDEVLSVTTAKEVARTTKNETLDGVTPASIAIENKA